MLKDKVKYGVEISTPKKEYKAFALNYKRLKELIYEATTQWKTRVFRILLLCL